MFKKLRNIKGKFSEIKEFSEESYVSVSEKAGTTIKNSTKSILGGNFLKSNFVRSQYGLIIMFMVLSFAYIGHRYYFEKQLAEIDRLQRRLENVRFTYLTISRELIEESRESKVIEAAKARGITLQISTRPPYRLY